MRTFVVEPGKFETTCDDLTEYLLTKGEKVDQPPHQMEHLSTDPRWVTREVKNIVLEYKIPYTQTTLAEDVKPNLPWADDHFAERVGGEPLNPPPSHKRWPYARAGNEEHMEGGKFSHTYPERFWPKHAGEWGCNPEEVALPGIRFEYGDYSDLILQLWEHPLTRQAYLPIWFPEDLTAAAQGQRVPCTLGYHLMMRGNELNVTYFIRSCDIVRYFRDDVYMACRMAQHVLRCLQARFALKEAGEYGFPWILASPGKLTMHVVSMHCFEGDIPLMDRDLYETKP